MTHRTTQPDLLVGVDVGGSTIVVLVTDARLRVVARAVSTTVRGVPDGASRQVASAIMSTLSQAGLPAHRMAALGVGIPGRVDPDSGIATLAVNLGWRDVPLRADLESLLGVPCRVANDVRAAADGVRARRLLGAVDDFVYLSVGTGIAAGLVLDQKLRTGAHDLAGEIGHLVVMPDGPACACGQRGCLEALASGPAVATRAAAVLAAGRESTLSGASSLTAADVYGAARDGDGLALEIVADAGRHLAGMIHVLALALDVDAVCIGGGVAAAGATFLEPIEHELERLRGSSDLAATVLPPDLLHLLPADDDTGAWGAVLLASGRVAWKTVPDMTGKEVGVRSVPPRITI